MTTPHDTEQKKTPDAPADAFGSAFMVWCIVVFGGSLVSGTASAAYGALTPGAMFGVAALGSGIVAIIVVIARRKDRRAWISLGLCILAAIVSTLKSGRHGVGP